MDSAMQERIEEAVMSILKKSDLQEMTEFNVRKEASDMLDIDLSQPSRKMFVRQIVESFLHQKAYQNDAVEEEGEKSEEECEPTRSDGKEYDHEGNLIICQLSEKRRVTVQDFRGKKLVSIREYYEKDGKFLPTSKGISLNAAQWSSFKNNVSEVEKAIEIMEGRLN